MLPDEPSNLYIIRQIHDSDYKLGRSVNGAIARSLRLPERNLIDYSQSYAWRITTAKRAQRLESLLHWMLRRLGYQRLRRHTEEGYTEWYAAESLPLVDANMAVYRDSWTERVQYTAPRPLSPARQLRRLIRGLQMSIEDGDIALEGRDGPNVFARIDAPLTSRGMRLLYGSHRVGRIELECYEASYCNLLAPGVVVGVVVTLPPPDELGYSAELAELCALIPPYTGDAPPHFDLRPIPEEDW